MKHVHRLDQGERDQRPSRIPARGLPLHEAVDQQQDAPGAEDGAERVIGPAAGARQGRR